MLNQRAEAMKIFINALSSNGPLREELTLNEAAETVWAITSAEVYTLMVKDRGWPLGKYQKWLAMALTNLLLP